MMINREKTLKMLATIVGVLLLIFLATRTSGRVSDLSASVERFESEVTELTEELGERQHAEVEALIQKTFGWPMHPDDYQRMTSWFGVRNIPSELYKGGSPTRDHSGIDIKGFEQARIVPIAVGEVVEHYLPPGWYWGRYYSGDDLLGGKIIVDHHNGWFSVYGHMSVTYVSEGDWVTPEKPIGRQGSTGMSTGPHLHFELWEGWENPVQPLIYMVPPVRR